MLTAALLFAPLRTSRRFARLIAAMMRDGGPVEAGQYLVALLGAVVSAPGLWALLLLVPPAALLYKITKHTKEMQDGTRQLLERMADTVDLRDPYTGGHSRRVAELCAGILRALPLRGPEATLIISAARVHDIGKVGIPDAVLLKDGRLTDEESAIMRTHPVRGADLLAQYPDFARGADIVRHHHERWDGKGYPDGLDGTDIPLGARVIAVADSFDAMTTDRPYRAGIPVQGAAAILREGSGTEWEPVIVQAFLRSIADRLEEAQSGTPTEASVPSISTTLLVSPLTEGLDLICRDEPLHQILEQPDQDLPMRRRKAQTWS
jgi:HD-GYP domain-containing protein (c-di-GMP phosphodiesterase class II)